MDRILNTADFALRTLFARPRADRAVPKPNHPSTLSKAEARTAGALMRVNHVGEVCAQAMYAAQALTARTPRLRTHFEHAAAEETDHLAWTAQRLEELHAKPSVLNPLWFAGAFGIGLVAGAVGDRVSLGFVAETERQVESHLSGHLDRLPANDVDSRAIVAQMMRDEAQHAAAAVGLGGAALPAAVRGAMRLCARIMTTVAHYV